MIYTSVYPRSPGVQVCSAQGESNVNKLKCLPERAVLIAWYFRMKWFPLIIKALN